MGYRRKRLVVIILLRVAERAVEVFQAGLAPRILFSGGRGNFTETWDQPEAVTFSLRAAELGVPSEAMLLETTSSNTGQNVRNSHRLLEEQNFQPSSVILVQKPFMERRCDTYMTLNIYSFSSGLTQPS